MQVPPSICLITPGHVASAPRLVKEADALVEAGYRVHVIAGRHFAPVDSLDAPILEAARWSHHLINYTRGSDVFLRKLTQRAARLLVTHAPFANVRIAALANHAQSRRLANAAAAWPARLYIGHCLAGLPAAALAAQKHGAHYGFDAEDFHDEETEPAAAHPADRAAVRLLQSHLLPGCRHRTASAPLIAEALSKRYGVPFTTVLNVFPRRHAPAAPTPAAPIGPQRPAQFYWFSQTIGPGRGLERIVAVLGRMRTPVELRLRGFPVPGYAAGLQSLATAAGMSRPIVFLPSAPPAEMARLAASADLGLSLEETSPLNRDLCLTNKIFVYLLAGVPQLLSKTSAQAALAPLLGNAALPAQLDRIDETAALLDAFFEAPDRVAVARQHAWSLAMRRFCWDVEQEVLLRSVQVTLSGE